MLTLTKNAGTSLMSPNQLAAAGEKLVSETSAIL
jgi:hypothetical protein